MADHYICPGCGKEVKVGSKGCPSCNQLDPWEIEENQVYDGLDLPEEEVNYDDFVDREFGGQPPGKGMALVWWITAVLLLISFLFWIFQG